MQMIQKKTSRRRIVVNNRGRSRPTLHEFDEEKVRSSKNAKTLWTKQNRDFFHNPIM